MSKYTNQSVSTKRSILISFLSGKGGAGKTSVSLGIAKILSSLKYKVLFVDLDLQTHGASYFFIDFCDTQNKRGLLELLQDLKEINHLEQISDLTGVTVKISENWDFIPSKSIFKEKTWELSQNVPVVRTFIEKCFRHFKDLDYDFVLFDTQAGPTASTTVACIHSQKAVIISEPDPISMATSRSLDYEIHEVLPQFTRFLVNKLNMDEIRSFRAIREYLTIFEHLSPLPFDFTVREAFSLRKIPVDTETPSPFLFGLITLTREILPTATERLDELEKRLKKSVFGEIREKRDKHTILIDELSARMNRLKEEQVVHEGILRRKIATLSSTLLITLTTLIVFYLIFLKRFEYSFIAILAIVAGLASTIPIIVDRLRWGVTTRKRMVEMEIEKIQEQLQSIRREKEKYDAMLLEKSDQFMLESE